MSLRCIGSLQRSKGFSLLITIVFLMVFSMLVINSFKSGSYDEKSAAAYMERSKAFIAAESALNAGEALLRDSACADSAGCSSLTYTGAAAGSTTVTVGTDQLTSWGTTQDTSAWATRTVFSTAAGIFLINKLYNSSTLVKYDDCPVYVITAKGLGNQGGGQTTAADLNSAASANAVSSVVLQSTVKACNV